jgi:fructose-1,6-bisphosphatase II
MTFGRRGVSSTLRPALPYHAAGGWPRPARDTEEDAMSGTGLDRNLALDLVRVTEASALAAARFMGRGMKNEADQASVTAMRFALASIDMDGIVVIGEGEKDEAPMLYIGERIGNGRPPEVDIAVDPIDGTRLLAQGMPNSVSVVALSERGTMFNPPGIVYMDKLAVGPAARGKVNIQAPVEENLEAIRRAKGCDMNEVTICILDRPRHEDLIRRVRAAGARIKLITDGDVGGSIMAVSPESGVDALMGVGGAPEAVISAAAMKCYGGEMQCLLWPRNDAERRSAEELGLPLDTVLDTDALCKGDNVFVSITGITDGELLKGVRYGGAGAATHSLVMRSRSGTIRSIEANHRWDKLMAIANIPYRGED